jgi:hypothetical protein
MSKSRRLGEDRPRQQPTLTTPGAAMNEMTQYVLGLDQTALGYSIAAFLGLLGCIALGAMRGDIRRDPSPPPIVRMIAFLRHPQSL